MYEVEAKGAQQQKQRTMGAVGGLSEKARNKLVLVNLVDFAALEGTFTCRSIRTLHKLGVYQDMAMSMKACVSKSARKKAVPAIANKNGSDQL